MQVLFEGMCTISAGQVPGWCEVIIEEIQHGYICIYSYMPTFHISSSTEGGRIETDGLDCHLPSILLAEAL